eukprot:TRINITY_DN1271_c0_g1_i1.p2 TRINITY_DN1271_c0_g1~~TRINITY_DN1271_c0_g1_i1.p2  ORF type:complete len:169 (-),score=9.81 TRINITY_DN1271_c0_g1_i1:188-694(-)
MPGITCTVPEVIMVEDEGDGEDEVDDEEDDSEEIIVGESGIVLEVLISTGSVEAAILASLAEVAGGVVGGSLAKEIGGDSPVFLITEIGPEIDKAGTEPESCDPLALFLRSEDLFTTGADFLAVRVLNLPLFFSVVGDLGDLGDFLGDFGDFKGGSVNGGPSSFRVSE